MVGASTPNRTCPAAVGAVLQGEKGGEGALLKLAHVVELDDGGVQTGSENHAFIIKGSDWFVPAVRRANLAVGVQDALEVGVGRDVKNCLFNNGSNLGLT